MPPSTRDGSFYCTTQHPWVDSSCSSGTSVFLMGDTAAGAVAGALLGVSMGTAAGSYNLRASWLLQRSLWRRRAAAQGLHSALVLLVATSRLCWCVRPGLRSAALIYEAPTLHTFVSAREKGGGSREAGPQLD